MAAEAEEALTMLGPSAIERPDRARALPAARTQRAVCVELLGRLGATSRAAPLIDALHAALGDESDEVVRAALDALAAAGDERSLRAAAARLGAEEAPAVRKGAAKALAAIARRHRGCGAPAGARGAAGPAGGAGGGRDHRARSGPGCGAASRTTSRSCPPCSRAKPVWCAAPRSKRWRRSAARSAWKPWRFALTDEEREVQLAAVRALGRLRGSDGSAAGTAQLLELVGRSEEDEELAAAAVRALGDGMDPRALGVLRPIARTGTPMVAVAAVEALATMGDPRRIDSLTAALSHTDSEVVKAALRAIAGERDVRVAAHIGACLDHQAWDVRRLAADLLGQTGGETAIELLRAKLANEDEPLVKDAVHRALIEIEGGSAVRRTAPPPRPGSWPPR